MMRLTALALALPAAFAAALPASQPAGAQTIGTVASESPAVQGTPPGAGIRTLVVGTDVVADERVATSAVGRAQLLFLDQTTITVAPNSVVVLDRFVFDPASQSGSFGLTLTTGALRFIGGALSREEEAEITTASATVGIRGSTGIVAILNGQTYGVFLAGAEMCITQSGAQVCTNRSGGLLGPGGYLGRADPAFIAQLIARIDGTPPPQRAGAGIGIAQVVRPGEGPFSTEGGLRDPGAFDDFQDQDTLQDLIVSEDEFISPGLECEYEIGFFECD